MDPEEAYRKVLSSLEEHHRWFDSSLPMIASENVTSPAVRSVLTSDFGHRYAEGWVGERVYAGTKYIDRVESLAMELIREIYEVRFADVRPISGVVANLSVYTALTQPGGGSHARAGRAAARRACCRARKCASRIIRLPQRRFS